MIISFAYNKGGVGKTTMTNNVGGILSSMGYQVLMIDMDGQFNLSSTVGLSRKELTIYDSMVRGKNLPVYSVKENLYCVPSSIDMNALDADMSMKPGREYYLKKLLTGYQESFDFVLFDCPPSIGIATMNALTASDYVVVPVEGRYLSVRSIGVMIDLISDIKSMVNPNLKNLGVVMTRFRQNERVPKMLRKEIIEELKLPMFDSSIRENVHVGESPMFGQDILAYNSGSLGASDYKNFVNELLEKIDYGKGKE